MTVTFDITPEKEASTSAWLYRQFFLTPSPVTPRDADLTGKTAIVTGATVGLGLETARQLLDLNCKVILAVRDQGRGRAARENILKGRNLARTPDVEVWDLDLASYESILSFVERAKGLQHLDIAILNAGIYKVFEQFDVKTGYETTVQVNYLANVLLMTSLIPIIKDKRRPNSPPGRLVLVNSDVAGWAKFPERTEARTIKNFLSIYKKPAKKWDMQERYGVSKLLGQFYLTELAKRVPSSACVITAANPGMCYGSEISREGKGMVAGYAWIVISRIFGRSCAAGARVYVHAAVDEGLGERVHGQYIEDARLRPLAPVVYKPEGIKIAGMVWEETMEELRFAGIREIVEELQKSK